MERHEKKIDEEASRILLLLNSLLRWILYCISQTSLKRVIDRERRSDVFCITKCNGHLAKPNFFITYFYGIQWHV
jgi:hypothetical protein